ncbi:hypothetical protein UCMB321_0018 [Pseudomonas batumici]|uniref:Uncharacterized protein n=1 Tax=Pseudomonas batumici TaxID=226910 RepID=A0A0C2IGN1_9PSED|nr:hypothetical protein UCMB321_0018 [Pseudomonas batumici]
MGGAPFQVGVMGQRPVTADPQARRTARGIQLGGAGCCANDRRLRA